MIRTGQQDLDSICDTREVSIDGERINDVTRHPMMKHAGIVVRGADGA